MLKCIIVDDEKLATMVIETHLSKIPNVELEGIYNDPVEAFQVLQTQEIDFLILDIEMPNLSGIDLAKGLHASPEIIFTTANKDYALEGFELNAVDYIVKPITFERLLKAVNRVVQRKEKNKNKQLKEDRQDYLFLKENKRNVKVSISNILYLESQKDYVKVVTKLKTVITKQKLTSFEEILDPKKFMRVHRSFIVSIENIDAYSASGVEINKIEIPIGRNFKDEVITRLDSLGTL